MDILFLFKALSVVAGCLIGMVLGSLLSAIWLRLAARWMGFGKIPYLTAFTSALLSNFVALTFNLSILVANQGITIALLEKISNQPDSYAIDFIYLYPLIYFLYSTLLGLLITAVIFRRTLPNNKDNDSRLPFGDSLALTSLYFALAFTCTLLLCLLALDIILYLA